MSQLKPPKIKFKILPKKRDRCDYFAIFPTFFNEFNRTCPVFSAFLVGGALRVDWGAGAVGPEGHEPFQRFDFDITEQYSDGPIPQ
jgi:hypothetical protein